MTNETTLPELPEPDLTIACVSETAITITGPGFCTPDTYYSSSKMRAYAQQATATLRAELEQCRADALGDLREQVMGMQEAAYTFGENCKEAVVVALDGVIEAIDAARGAK